MVCFRDFSSTHGCCRRCPPNRYLHPLRGKRQRTLYGHKGRDSFADAGRRDLLLTDARCKDSWEKKGGSPVQVRSNVWLEREGKVVLSEWRVALLEAIDTTGSINAAAARQGVHFRVAWRKLREMEDRLGVKLTERRVGGPHGGGTRLTAAGRAYVRKFRVCLAGLKETVNKRFKEQFGRW